MRHNEHLLESQLKGLHMIINVVVTAHPFSLGLKIGGRCEPLIILTPFFQMELYLKLIWECQTTPGHEISPLSSCSVARQPFKSICPYTLVHMVVDFYDQLFNVSTITFITWRLFASKCCQFIAMVLFFFPIVSFSYAELCMSNSCIRTGYANI